jgi:hypothetical protein
MESGIWGVLLGLGALVLFEATPPYWLRAAGGALILLTVGVIALQLLGVA